MNQNFHKLKSFNKLTKSELGLPESDEGLIRLIESEPITPTLKAKKELAIVYLNNQKKERVIDEKPNKRKSYLYKTH